VFPGGRAEFFGSMWYNSAKARIQDFAYDGGQYTAQMVGLDFPLHSASMSGFSDLKFARVGITGGLNYRLTNDIALNTMVEYSDYDDKEPWLEDVSGSYIQFFAGVNWIF
jgi:hypothetical protein